MKKSMTDFLSQQNTKLYRFAYSLIPDELQAEQILVDAVSGLLLEQADLIERICFNREIEEKKEMLNQFLLVEVYRLIFKISCKRWSQVEGGVRIPRFYAAFYHLTLSDRALLFLYHYGQLSLLQISEIVGMDIAWTQKREKQLEQILYQEIMVDEEEIALNGVYE